MRLSCKILLLASFFGFSCSEEEEEEGAEQQFREVAGAFRAVNQVRHKRRNWEKSRPVGSASFFPF